MFYVFNIIYLIVLARLSLTLGTLSDIICCNLGNIFKEKPTLVRKHIIAKNLKKSSGEFFMKNPKWFKTMYLEKL